MNGYDQLQNDVLKEFSVDQTKGLTDKQVLEQRAKYGENKLQEKGGESLFHMIIGYFINLSSDY